MDVLGNSSGLCRIVLSQGCLPPGRPAFTNVFRRRLKAPDSQRATREPPGSSRIGPRRLPIIRNIASRMPDVGLARSDRLRRTKPGIGDFTERRVTGVMSGWAFEDPRRCSLDWYCRRRCPSFLSFGAATGYNGIPAIRSLAPRRRWLPPPRRAIGQVARRRTRRWRHTPWRGSWGKCR